MLFELGLIPRHDSLNDAIDNSGHSPQSQDDEQLQSDHGSSGVQHQQRHVQTPRHQHHYSVENLVVGWMEGVR